MKKVSMLSINALIILTLIILLNPISVSAKEVDLSKYQQVRYVSVNTGSDTTGDGSKEAPWKTLYYAVSHIESTSATNRYALLVASGTYKRSGLLVLGMRSYVDVYGGYDQNDWTRADSTKKSVLDGSGEEVVYMFSNCVLDGFVITNSSDYYSVGAKIEHMTDAIIRDCTFTNLRLGGIYAWSTLSLKVDRCVFINNYEFPDACAIKCEYNSNVEITNCMICRNTSDDFRSGILCKDSSPDIVNCTIVDNLGCGIACEGSSNPRVINCILNNRGDEISGGNPEVSYSCIQGGWPGVGNINSLPSFVDREENDYRLANGSPCINAASSTIAPATDLAGISRPKGSNADMGAYEAPASYTQGTVNEYVSKRLYVRADAPVGGDGLGWQTAYQTLTQAMDQVYGGDEIWVSGGTYHETLIMEPSMTLYGGFDGTETLLSERNWIAHPTIIDASGLETSAAVGAARASINGLQLANVNAYIGSGLFCAGCSPSIENCWIFNNSSTLGSGGVECQQASPRFTNCIIAGNSYLYAYGSAINGINSSPVLNHCTIYGNKSKNGSALKFQGSSQPVITNCILLNPGPEISASNIQISYSCLQGGWNGIGNIDCPPQLVDPEHGDFHLLDGSPCIGRATDTVDLATDFEGNPRPQGEGPDMGAYEAPAGYIQGSTTVTPSRRYVSKQAPQGGDGSSWENAFSSIMDAIDQSWDGDEIWVAEGTYNEAVYMEVAVAMYGGFSGVESGLSERNWREHPTIIDAKGLGTQAVETGNGSLLDGFTITGSTSSGINCDDQSVRIKNCTIIGNSNSKFTYAGGVNCKSASLEIINSTITNNVTINILGGGGIHCDSSEISLTNCVLIGNSRSNKGGGLYGVYSTINLTNCQLEKNMGGAIYCATSTVEINGCCISENEKSNVAGGLTCEWSKVTVKDTIFVKNTNTTRSGGGIYLNYSTGLIERTSLVENTATSQQYRGGGLCCTNSTCQINSCLFSGNSVDGAYIYDSTAEFFDCQFAKNSFTGIRCLYSPDLKITKCTVTDTNGGAIYCKYASAVLTSCTITDNINTVITAPLGAIHCGHCNSMSLYDCMIGRNRTIDGGGLYSESSSPNLYGCQIINNTATRWGGGLYLISDNSVIQNCIIRGNKSQRGGGIFGYNGNFTFSNCVLYENIATDEYYSGGGIYCESSRQNIYNCIFWNNNINEVELIREKGNLIQYCDIQGGFTGTGNIDSDPLFADPEHGDFHLQPTSPCIGMGIGPELNSLVPLYDIDGDSRTGTTCNIGADEYTGPTTIIDWFNY